MYPSVPPASSVSLHPYSCSPGPLSLQLLPTPLHPMPASRVPPTHSRSLHPCSHGASPCSDTACTPDPHPTYRIEALQAEAIGCPALAAVHVVPKGQDDLRRHPRQVGIAPQQPPVPLGPPLGLPLTPLTSRMLRSLLEDLRDMEAAMMALSCCGWKGST